MATVTVEHETAEPGKRVLRNVLAWVIGTATALPVILGAIVLPKGTEIGVVVADVVAVSTGVTGLMANPTINGLLKKIGLGATTVVKLKTATLAAADPITPTLEAAIKAVLAARDQAVSGNYQQAAETAEAAATALGNAAAAEVPLVKAAVDAGK